MYVLVKKKLGIISMNYIRLLRSERKCKNLCLRDFFGNFAMILGVKKDVFFII